MYKNTCFFLHYQNYITEKWKEYDSSILVLVICLLADIYYFFEK